MQRPHRYVRTAAVVSLALAGLTCRERNTTGPGLPTVVTLAIAPHVSAQAGVPTVRMATVRAVARRLPGGFVALDTVATFPATNDELSLSLRIPMLQPQETYELLIRGIAATGDTVYAATDTVTLQQGADPAEPVSVDLGYVGPDTIVATLTVAPRDTTFRSSDTVQMRAVARRLTGDPVPTAAVEWISRDPSRFEIDPITGRLTARGTFSGVWIVAATANARFDSTQVSSIPPVSTVAVDLATPGEQTVPRGTTRRFTVTLRGPAGEVITGRAVAWSVDRPLGGTVDDTGLFTALRADSVVTVTATAEGRTGTVVVRVGRRGVSRVDLGAATDTILPGASRAYTAAAFDSAGADNPDHPIVWTSLDPSIATVTSAPDGRSATVTGVRLGSTTIRASAGAGASGAQGDLALAVHFPLDSIVVSPRLDTLRAFGDVAAHTVTGFRGGAPLGGVSFVWSSRAPAVASVDDAGNITAVADGATWIDVAETTSSFGRRDSVRVVVRQRVASFVVTPSDITRYATTRQRFDVAAADSRGVAIASRAYAWTTRSGGEVVRVDSTIAGAAFTRMIGLGADTVVVTDPESGMTARAAVRVISLVVRVQVTPSDTSVTAFGDRVTFTAVARDSADAPLDVPITWSSSAAGVMRVDSTGPGVAHTTSVSNGAAGITAATADGVGTTVTVTVAQQPQTVVASPDALSLAVGETNTLTAEVRDRNGNAMTGFPFTWESSAPEVASVAVDVGAVTGNSDGVALVTARAAGLTSAPVTVTVEGGVAIEFGGDSVRMMPATRVLVPVRLASAAPDTVWVQITPMDTADGACEPMPYCLFGHDPDAGTVGVSIPYLLFRPGETVQYAELRGNAPGVARLLAARVPFPLFCFDGRGGCCGEFCGGGRAARPYPERFAVFESDTLVVTVQSGVLHLDRTVSLARGDSAMVRVELPAPEAAPVRVVFEYTAAGVIRARRPNLTDAQADTVEIPAGSVAADVVVTGLADGAVLVRPVRVGGSAGAQTSAVVRSQRLVIFADLRQTAGALLIGAGQLDTTSTTTLPAGASDDLAVAFTTTDAAVAEPLVSAARVNGATGGTRFAVRGVSPGRATVAVGAPGWAGDTLPVRVSTPYLVALQDTIDTFEYDPRPPTDADTVAANGDPLTLRIATTDSLQRRHPRAQALSFRLTSDNPAVVAAERDTGSVEAMRDIVPVRVLPLAAGTANVCAIAESHASVCRRVVVIERKLAFRPQYLFSLDSNAVVYLADGFSVSQPLLVETPDVRESPLPIRLTSSHPLVAIDDSTFVGAGSRVASVNRLEVAEPDGGPRADQSRIVATAPGYAPDTLQAIVTRPRARLENLFSDTLFTAFSYQFPVLFTDSLGFGRFRPRGLMTVRWTSSNPAVMPDLEATVEPEEWNPFPTYRTVAVKPAAAGDVCWTTQGSFIPDTLCVTVRELTSPRAISLNFPSVSLADSVPHLAIGTRFDGASVELSATRDTLTNVVLRVLPGAGDPAPATFQPDRFAFSCCVTYGSFALSGQRAGSMLLEAADSSGAGYSPDTARVIVTSGAVRFLEEEIDPDSVERSLPPARIVAGSSWIGKLRVVDSVEAANGWYPSNKRLARGTLVRVTSSDPAVMLLQRADDGSGAVPAASVDVFADDSTVIERLQLLAQAAGTTRITVTDVSNELGGSPVLFESYEFDVAVDAPRLVVDRSKFRSVGARQRTRNTVGACRDEASRHIVFRMVSSDSTIAVARSFAGTDELDMPAFTSCDGFFVLGRRPGTVSMTFEAFEIVDGARVPAPWHAADTLRVEVGQPELRPNFAMPVTRAVGDSLSALEMLAYDHRGEIQRNEDSVRVVLTSSDPAVLVPRGDTITITPSTVSGFFLVVPKSPGTAVVTAVDIDATGDRAYRFAPVTIHVRESRLEFLQDNQAIAAPAYVGRDMSPWLRVRRDPMANGGERVVVRSLDTTVVAVLQDTLSFSGEGFGLSEIDVWTVGRGEGVTRLIVEGDGFAPDTMEVRVNRGVASLEPMPAELPYGSGTSVQVRLTDSTFDANAPGVGLRFRLDSSAVFDILFVNEAGDTSATSPVLEMRTSTFSGIVITSFTMGGGEWWKSLGLIAKGQGTARILIRQRRPDGTSGPDDAGTRIREWISPRVTVRPPGPA